MIGLETGRMGLLRTRHDKNRKVSASKISRIQFSATKLIRKTIESPIIDTQNYHFGI